MLEHHGAPPGEGAHRPGASTSEPDPSSPGAALAGLRAVIDRLPEAVLVTAADGAVRLTNGAADRLFAGRPVQDDADLLSRFEDVGPAARRPLRGEPSRRLTVRPRDQPNTWFALDRVPFDEEAPADPSVSTGAESSSEPVGSVFVLRDVSNSRDLRAEREAFLAVLSHELRTPLTTIYAGSSVLARRPQLSPPATRTLALDISSEAAHLYDLVENLLVIARLERRILDPLDEPVDVRRTVDSAIRTTRERFPDVRVAREGVRRPPVVHGDATYVEQACRNLILSAVQASAAGDEIVVRIDLDEDRREVAVRVLDRGLALGADELLQAFNLPASTAVGRLAGAGMGPFVVRHAIEAMNGRTWARNREDGGLEMGFALRTDDPV
jgi:signal transduction histidine kinase